MKNEGSLVRLRQLFSLTTECKAEGKKWQHQEFKKILVILQSMIEQEEAQ